MNKMNENVTIEAFLGKEESPKKIEKNMKKWSKILTIKKDCGVAIDMYCLPNATGGCIDCGVCEKCPFAYIGIKTIDLTSLQKMAGEKQLNINSDVCNHPFLFKKDRCDCRSCNSCEYSYTTIKYKNFLDLLERVYQVKDDTKKEEYAN